MNARLNSCELGHAVGARIPRFEEIDAFGAGLRHMTRVEHDLAYWADATQARRADRATDLVLRPKYSVRSIY